MLWAIGIEARLVWLQVGQHDWLASRATRQHRSTVSLAGQRGEILDRNGRMLALSVDAETIQAVPGDIDDPARTAASLCRALEKLFGRPIASRSVGSSSRRSRPSS